MQSSVQSRRSRLLGVIAIVGASVLASASLGAASTANGVIKGTVTECAPGPIVYAPNKPAPRPTPVTITLRHDGKPFQSQAVKFPSTYGWRGTFSFRVPAGEYEVLASAEGYLGQWVHLAPATHRTVSFGFFACPL